MFLNISNGPVYARARSMWEVSMIQSTPVYSLTYRRPEELVELTWLAGTQSMTDEDFRASLVAFAECALQHRARCLIVDMREFKHRPSSEVLKFRDDVIVPKYVTAGVKKVAWVWPGESGDRITETAGGTFENRYVDTAEQAFDWLTAK
jgi:hypothetical protein